MEPMSDISDNPVSILDETDRTPGREAHSEAHSNGINGQKAAVPVRFSTRYQLGLRPKTDPTRQVSDATVMLAAMERGDPNAAEELLVLVYDELRRIAAAKMAHEAPGQTLNRRRSYTRRGCGWWQVSVPPS